MKKLSFLLVLILAAGMVFAGGGSDSTASKGSSTGGGGFVDNEPIARFPSRPIEVISQFGTGGGTDNYIRALGPDSPRILGQTVLPIPTTGGGGMTAWERFRTQVPDGYTLYAIGPEQVIMHNLGQINFLENVQPLIRSQSDIYMYFARGNDNRFPTIEAVIAEAKANPGKLSIGYTNPASYDEVQIGLFCMEHGINLNFTPYPSASEAFAAMLGGHIDLIGEEIGPALGLIESKDLRPLVIFIDADRVDHPLVRDVPTSQSKGWSKDLTIGRWRGLGISKGASPEKMAKLIDGFKRIMDGNSYKNYEKQSLLDIRPGFMGPEDFTSFIRNELDLYKKAMDSIGMKLQ